MTWTTSGDSDCGTKLLSVEINMDGTCRTEELFSAGSSKTAPKFTTNSRQLSIYDFVGVFTLVGLSVSL